MTAPHPAAYEHNGQPCDRATFYAIACDPQRHVVVQACAGAGKTWMLVSRILRALLLQTDPEDILAITFTKKAAGEMRARLDEWLRDFARPRAAESTSDWHARLDIELRARGISDPDAQHRDTLAALYEGMLTHGRGVQIRTFHSWFAALLRNAPLGVLAQLGLPAPYELLEKDEDAIAQVWRPYLRRIHSDSALRADYTALLHTLGRHNAQLALQAALQRRVEFARADEAGHVHNAIAAPEELWPHLAGLPSPAHALMSDSAQNRWHAWAATLGQGHKTAQKAANGIIDAFLHTDPEQRLATLRKAIFVASAPRLNQHLTKIDAAQAAEVELRTLILATEQQQAREHHLRMARLLRPLIEEYTRLKQRHGWVDMADIESAAHTLLADHALSGWIQQRLDAQVRQLLIDEFQDTNPLQWQALHAWLSGYVGAGGGGHAPPSVFIVGDPKQSIYRFRRADPKVFEAAQDFVVQALGGDRLACDHTRRNSPAVLAAVNPLMLEAQNAGEFSGFRPHTTESDTSGQVQTLPLIPRPGKGDSSAVSADSSQTADSPDPASPPPASEQPSPDDWRDTLVTPQQTPEDTLRMLECRQAAHWIARRIADGVTPDNIMVLARKRLPLGLLQAELRHLGIACVQPEARRLAEQPVARDLLALVEALLSPGHNLALAQALKSPLFGLGDEDLIRIAQTVAASAAPHATHAPPTPWLHVLPQAPLLAADAPKLHADLLLYRRWLLSLPPHDALQRIYQHSDAIARCAAAAPPAERPQVIAHLNALLSSALHVQGGRHLSAWQWLNAVRRDNIEAPRATAAGRDCVPLLTIHGAKGLEADEVLLLDTDSVDTGSKGPPLLIDWPGNAPAPLRLAFLSSAKAVPHSLQTLAQQEAAAQEREELNALYVALTRARQRLYISAFQTTRKALSWWQRLGRLPAPIVTPIIDIGPAAQHDAAPASQAAPGHFTLRELPADARTPPDIRPGAAAGTPSSRLGQAMHWLLEHARANSAHPWPEDRLTSLPRRFAITPEQARQAHDAAQRILQGQAAWAWQREHILQSFNEVELRHDNQALRIDRLVLRRPQPDGTPATWWVLDYKSALHPERDPALIAQLQRYRQAIQALHPAAPVRAAFLTPDGRIIDIA